MTKSFLLAAALLALRSCAQTASPYTDEASGITFNGLIHSSGYRFGLALPETIGTDFIGQIVAPVNSTGGGWAGADMSSSMTGKLLIVAWPNGDEVISSFRLATGYTSPPVVTGDYSLASIPNGTYVNDTAFSYTFLCSKCITDDGLDVSAADTVLGWAYSTQAVADPTSASSALTYHSAGFGAFGLTIANAQSADYATWAALASAGSNSTTPGNSTSPINGGGSTNGTTGGNTTATVSNSTYDYIVAGGGPAGIIAAERLAESGASVLLLERGGPSLASSGNTDTLSWNSSVTMYDVPGVDYYLSTVGSPAFCTDTADQAGCLLGGGSMVNAMMFVKPQDRDFDEKWPAGWKSSDVAEAASRLYERNPGQTYGSEDGLRYNNQAYDVLSQFLGGNGFKSVDALEQPNEKIDVYSHPPWNLANGLRSGPVRTYLPLAQALPNFKLQLNTQVIRAIRKGSTITGVETKDSTGARVIYNVNPNGRVVLAAGAMSTPRILFNSGIGPSAQLQTVASGTTGVNLPAESDWIDLPVGAQIKDHIIFTLKFSTNTTMPALAATEFTSPNQTSIDLFAQGNGVLAQSGQRLNFWTAVNATNSSSSQIFIQGTCNGPANNTIQMKIYLTHGLTSVGSLGITADGATELSSEPWLQTQTDIDAATSFMNRLLAMTRAPGSTLSFLSAGSVTASPNVTGADLIKDHTTGLHYVGTAKMGTQGEEGVVVDTDTKVYGTDNLFVVDASMHPDLPTGNTQAIVMVAAEAAAAKILALGSNANSTTNGTSDAVSSTALPADPEIPSGATSIPVSPTSTIAAASQTTRPSRQRPSPQPQPPRNGNNPWWRPNGKKTSTLSTITATPTPAAQGKRNEHAKRDAKIPVGPYLFEDETEIEERSRMERASFLDSY